MLEINIFICFGNKYIIFKNYIINNWLSFKYNFKNKAKDSFSHFISLLQNK